MRNWWNGLAAIAMVASAVGASAQAPKRMLESDASAAATTCWFAYAVASNADGRIDTSEMADALWFSIESARANPMKGPVLEQIPILGNQRPADEDSARRNAADLKTQCMKRFPKSVRGATKIVVPADRFARELLCTAVASFFMGVAQQEEKNYGNSALMPTLKAINDRGVAYMTDTQLTRLGIATQDELLGLYSLALARAVRLGNFNDIIAACR